MKVFGPTLENFGQADRSYPKSVCTGLTCELEYLRRFTIAAMTLRTIVLGHLKRLSEGPERFDVSLDAHVPQDKQRGASAINLRPRGRHPPGDLPGELRRASP
jgi:hypothetical protein